ncbi:MAG: hypothetical protein K2P94_01335 [Rhodospirillaceae bacterium]|nr:hypothetical protein [Rhodospirillaceae bacterium]
MFEVDPDKPDIPALARILSGMGILCLIGSGISGMLAFSKYEWLNENYAMAGAIGGFLLALVFIGQAKTIELLAVVSARVKSRYAIDNLSRSLSTAAPGAPSMMAPSAEKKPGIITQPVKERVIHVPDEQARQQGFKVR